MPGRPFSRALRRAAAIGVALLLVGCAGLAGLDKPPRVSLVSIKPVEFQLLEQRYVATLRVQNPNNVDLGIAGLDYVISVNGREFGNGVSNERITVPAYGEATLDVSMTSTLVRLFDQLRGFSDSDGVLRYGISGTLGISGRPGGVPFSHDGEIDLSPPSRSKGLAV